MKPFALELYDRFRRGETVEQISMALRIPAERVMLRIRAAEQYTRRRSGKAA